MNIAFYTEWEISPYTGGIGRVTSILTDCFRHQYGWKVFAIYAKTIPASFSKTEVDGECQGRLHDRFGVRRDIGRNTGRAAEFIKENHVDVVIVQTSMDVPMRLRTALHRIGYDTKIITCLHFAPGTDIFLNKLSDIRKVKPFSANGIKTILKVVFSVVYNPLITQLTRRCYQKAYCFSDLVLLLSESYKEEFCKFSGVRDQKKLMAMPNPLSFNNYLPESELKNKKPVALVVGRMSEYQKRISRILSVWGEYEKRNPDSTWHLKIVGDGASLPEYKRQSMELGLKRCCFEGAQAPIPYYEESSLFLMTSAFEGLPMTLLEAQQFGCVPIVMNAFSSLPEIVTDRRNGIIVDNGDAKQFLSAIEELAADSDEWHRLAVNAIKDCQHFSQDSICAKWKKLIEEVTK
ncbi:MAG: glycosyltransferase [Prevotella sp.]|nr:glycosyltransferase [Prevotella sp.]